MREPEAFGRERIVRAELQGEMPKALLVADISGCQDEDTFLWIHPSSDHQCPHPVQFQEQEKGKQSRTLNKIEASAHCEWEQMNLRSSLARNAGKQNAPFWILMAES